MARGESEERPWGQLEPLLPSSKGKGGAQWRDYRLVINGIRWVLRTGAGWADIPARYGPITRNSRRKWELDRTFWRKRPGRR